MAFSKIIIDFEQVPQENEVLNFSETLLGLNLNSIFKNARAVATEVALPGYSNTFYEMTLADTTDITNIDVEYTPEGGVLTQEPLSSIFVLDNLDGTFTYQITSSTPVQIIDALTDTYILWTEGAFVSKVVFSGFVSENYKTAFDLDYNATASFTTTATTGAEGTGIGTVTITATFPNAFFEVVSNTSLVTVTITNEVSLDPVSSVAPLLLDFQVVKAIDEAPAKQVAINALEPWSIATLLPAWLELSALSGAANTVLDVSPVNYAALASGLYETAFDVVIGADTFTVAVSLTVSNFLTNPFAPGKLYFTQQLDYLAFDSETPGTYIDFNIEIKVFQINTYEPIIYTRSYKFPLFQGKGNFHIGTIVHELFEEIKALADFVPNLKTNYTKTQYRPAEITVSFEEKTFGETVEGLVSSTIPMFKMAKGHKPFTTENQLALLTVAQQEITRITPNSFVGTSFVYFGTPRVIVKKNNVVIDDFEIEEEDPDKVIFSYFRFVNDVKPGDSLELIIVNELETRTQRFLVFQKGMECTYFFFENDNQMLEPFEFTGRRRVNSTLKNSVSTSFKDLYSYESKVNSSINQSFVVNTGNLTKTDHRMITALLASTKVWCSFDNPEGPYFRVDATTSKINNQDTATNEESFEIEFNILENANASIYPR